MEIEVRKSQRGWHSRVGIMFSMCAAVLMNMRAVLIIRLDFIKMFVGMGTLIRVLRKPPIPTKLMIKHKLAVFVEQFTIYKDFRVRAQVTNHIPMDRRFVV